MMSTQNNLTTVCCAAVLALGLAACGSSSDDNKAMDKAMTDTPTTISPMEPTAAEQLATAQDAVTDAQTKVGTLTADSSNSDRAAAYASLAAAQSALAEASGIPENEIALLKTEIARLQGVIDQAVMDAQTEADRIAAEAARIAALVAGTASAETKRKAIAAEDGTAGLGGIADAAEDAAKWTLGISRDRMATKIEITDPALAGDDDLKFVQAMDLGNGRTMHVREMEADADGKVVTEVVIVATDIQAPVATAFATVYELDTNPNDATSPVNQSLAVDEDMADVLKLVKSDDFVPGSGTSTELTFARAQEAANDDPAVAAFETAGTDNGAMGTYRCDATGADDCTVTLDAKGAITAMTWSDPLKVVQIC